MKRKILAFDLLRAIAILTVIISHSTSYFDYKYLKYIIAVFNPFFAQIGLGLFIFISGYVIYYNNSNISSIKDVLFFYKKRVLRIFPLYWVALAAFTLVFSVYSNILSSQFVISDVNSLFSFHNLIIHLLGMQIILAPTYSTPIFTLYFIGVIITFYLIYPFLMLYSKTTSRFLLISLFVFVSFAVISNIFEIIDGTFFSFYPIFIAGILLSRSSTLDKHVFNPYFAVTPIIFVLLLILQDRLFLFLDPRVSITAISASSGTIDSSVAITIIEKFATPLGLSYESVKFTITSVLFDVTIIMFCIAQLWIANICINDNISTLLSSIITFIATASYTVYLFHRPLLSLWISVSDQTNINSLFQDSITILLIIPVMFVISYYIQYIESALRMRLLTKSKK